MSKIFKDTELKIANSLNPQGRKMFIYAAHDLTLAGIFSALDIFDKTIVPVGSYWLLEVHNINGTYGFKVKGNFTDSNYNFCKSLYVLVSFIELKISSIAN